MAAKGLLLRLKDYQVKASAAEKNAVTIILNHPDMVIGKSIHEFADLAYASPATIIRLCRKLGCAGYRDFQHALVYENALFKDRYLFRRSSPRRRQRTLFKRLHEKTSSLLRRQESW